jgi:hypothetical protein
MNLQAAAASLTEQFPSGERDKLAGREQLIESFGRFAFGWFGIVLLLGVAGLIYMISRELIFNGREPWAGYLFILFLISAVLMLAYVFFREDLKDRRKKILPESPRELDKPAVTGKLLEEGEFEPIPSIVEETTDLLPVGRRRDEG